MSPPLCRFVNTPRGCHRGNQCNFSHPQPNQGSDSARPLSPPPAPNSSRQPQSTSHPSGSGNPPPGVCKFFWEQGRCKREFNCHYKHTQKADNINSSPASTSTGTMRSTTVLQRVAPFLTEEGLSKMSGSGTDGFFSEDPSSFSPSEAHNALKRFLSDVFRFKSTFEVYAFVKPLNSATASNAGWQNGLHRMIDIIRWPRVSANVGNSRDVLSFQRGILPILRVSVLLVLEVVITHFSQYLSSDFVVKSTLVTRVNTLFTEVLQNIKELADTIENSMAVIMANRSFRDPGLTVNHPQLGAQVLASIAGILDECLVRFKNAVAMYPRLVSLVTNLRLWFDRWTTGIGSSPPTFDNPFEGIEGPVRDLVVNTLREKVNRLESIVNRELGKVTRSGSRRNALSAPNGTSNEGLIAALHSNYDPPGFLRLDGPRHDNDLVDIYDIRVAPTHQELMCRTQPFLPASLYEAPHPAPADSMQRLLDGQFRLLREELTAPLRRAVQFVQDDLSDLDRRKTRLGELLLKGGGKYHGVADSHESLMFNVYTDVTFTALVPDRRGISTSITVATPPGRARSAQGGARVAFWKGMSGKRLVSGGLVALVWQTGAGISVHLGTIASSIGELTDHVKGNGDRVKIRVVFFDSDIELRILSELRTGRSPSNDIKVLVESPVLFEAIRPFLEALKTEPEIVPFSRYLVFHPFDYLRTCTIDPPKYARLPGFSFQLSSLLNQEAEVDDLPLSVSDKNSVDRARAELHRASRLDPSQADAVIAALTRELVLIQGYTGVELLRVLVGNRIGPILMIAFTNHALDHMLCSVLDAGITTDIVRLGSRSSDDRISQYSIETREMVAGRSRLHDTSSSKYHELRSVGMEISQLIDHINKVDLESDSSEIIKYLSLTHPEHHTSMSVPPTWIGVAKDLSHDDSESGERWKRQGRKGKVTMEDTSFYAFWKNSGDLEFVEMVTTPVVPNIPQTSESLAEPGPSSRSNRFEHLSTETMAGPEDSDEDERDEIDEGGSEIPPEKSWMTVSFSDDPDSSVDSETEKMPVPLPKPSAPAAPIAETEAPYPTYVNDPAGFFAALGEDGAPAVPFSNRKLDELLADGKVWDMSPQERKLLHAFWIERARMEMQQNQQDEFERLRTKHAEKVQENNEIKEEVRRDLLKNVKIIGCTTTGTRASIRTNRFLMQSYLQSLSPKVLMVEEAGQVLEAHVLGSLVPSVEHLILIGDPLQLRPTLNNFSLSVEHPRGNKLFRFDMSLMERLATSGLPMSRIDVQRRMRPTISSLIRNTLYEGLQDHDLVKSYPDVRGMVKNLFFVTHNHKENGGTDDTASKYNMHEVRMRFLSRDVSCLLFPRQGCYSAEGDIVVLCAYLGQLARLRDALGGEVAVVIDERDQADLDDREGDQDDTSDTGFGGSIQHVKVTSRVRLRTVDNYQGEEGKVVILSLVRNSGGAEDEIEMQTISQHTRVNIGFLKCLLTHFSAVALSRAREGLYIFGNADNLSSRSRMWRSIIEELDAQDGLGPGLPVACHRHRNKVEYVSRPGQLSRIAPDGGCMEQCDTLLKCGHLCPFKCHCDDPNHIAVICTKPCRRLCHRDHPCRKDCNTPCGSCQFPIPNVELPCGHVKGSVPCYQLDMIDSIRCDEEVDKLLPDCEHRAVMPCSQDPEDYRCVARCAELMVCCGKNCNATCDDCQGVNDAPDDGTPTKRTKHVAHPCQKRLYCEHSCQEPCSEDHEHATRCTAKCRQVCPHAQCKRQCSVPCAPCKQPCTWACPHYTCPVPCGSVCARLPCDKRCDKVLQCGHQCPSVCGEDCTIQVCPQCASEEKRSQVADLIMQRTLAEIDFDSESLDELLITIPSCRHTFTVETLDGHCCMTEFYSCGQTGKWLGLLSPIGFRRPPTCPTCRSEITAPRYGRVFKRANLDILERNVAAQMSLSLGTVQASLESVSVSSKKEKLVKVAATIDLEFKDKFDMEKRAFQAKARSRALDTKKEMPISEREISPASTNLHAIDRSVVDVWRKAMHELLLAYRQAVQVAETRSAHTEAWEAALSCLHEREVAAFLSDPGTSPREPMIHAMRVAKVKIGQPRPLADRRFLVEAIWLTIHIRLQMADLTTTWVDSISERTGGSINTSQQLSWATYIGFLFKSCLRDADVAFVVAKDSESHRQSSKTALYQMRISLEEFRFDMMMCKMTGRFKEQDRRDALVARASNLHEGAKELMNTTIQQHREKKTSVEEMGWLEANFSSVARDIVGEWASIERSIRMNTFYQPVSLEERIAIVKALNFSHAGHYYNCPNGHMFVITECGGASQVAKCPECDAVIGGSGHHLDASNTRNVEFEELARQAGAGENPWARPW
ncbi:hypothetical protein J3R83DRAFT_202 [Lanmaoa asiatica]|nr:hypothetical protein J3R83DRAFT_202 [Lanmaoa asiatica]